MWKLWLWIKEAIEGIFRNITFNSFVSLLAFLSFFILSFWIILMINVQYTAQKVENDLEISLYLKDEITDYEAVSEELKSMEEIENFYFITKDEAYQIMLNDLGDRKDMLTNIGFNPLPASFQIKVKNPESIKLVAKKLETLGVSKNIVYGENYVDKLFQITEGSKKLVLGILVLMILTTAAMIYVSVRLNIFNRNKELEIKDLVGAGRINIRVPFILEGIILTTFSAAVILGIVYFFYEKIVAKIYVIYPGTVFVGIENVMNSLTPTLLIIALFVGFISSLLSTQRYLKGR